MRYRKLPLLLSFLTVMFGVQAFAQINNTALFIQSEGLEFDKKEVFIVCPSAVFEREEPIVEVTTKTSEQPQNLKYRYSVSGGRIIGTGVNISWDLNKMPPGFYKLTVNVRGEKFRRKFTKEIRLSPLPICDPPCHCPTISIISPLQNIKAGKIAVFIAQLRGGGQNFPTYKWTLSEGKITKGQGTPRIEVKTKGLTGKTITATLEVGGDLCVECAREVSSTVEIN